MTNNNDDIVAFVKAKLGVHSMRLGDVVRKLPLGFSSCTYNSVAAATAYLFNEGIGMYPQEPRIDRDFVIRLYLLSSPVAELIDAVLRPAEENDRLLRSGAEFNSALDAIIDTF